MFWQSPTFWQFTVALGGILAIVGTLMGRVQEDRLKEEAKKEAKQELEKDRAIRREQHDVVTAQLGILVSAANIKAETWQAVETDMVPPGITAYLMLLFKADGGRIVGKIRVKGSDVTTAFATDANDETPVAVANVWEPAQKRYRTPTIVEFVLTEKTVPNSRLTIFVQGWIDGFGQPPGAPSFITSDEPDPTTGLPKLDSK